MKKVEDPDSPLEYPHVPPHKAKDFQRLLEYFGLVDYFNPPSSSTTMIFSAANFVQAEGRDWVTVTENVNNTVKLYKEISSDHYDVACTTELDPAGEGCFWKVNIDSLPSSSEFFFLGITGNLNLKYFTPGFATSFGWDDLKNVYRKGKYESETDGWTGFVHGECLYFHFKSNKLSMHSVQKKKTFVLDGIETVTKKYYFLTNITHIGTVMTIGPLNDEERKTFTDNE